MDSTKFFDDLTWDDVVIEHGAFKAIQEFSVNDMQQKDLHAVCSRLNIKGVKNTSKESMIEKIVSIYKLKERYGRLMDDVELVLTPARKEPQCPYRLFIILFSNMFSEGLAQIGNVADRFELDTGKASNNQLFWEGVQEAFTSHSELYDNLHSEDEVLSDLNHINFKNIFLHDWKKLCVIWKNLNAEYKAALSHYAMSGFHLSNFYEFSHGWKDVYYLQKHLEAKPNLNSTVAADLPEEVCLDSTGRPDSRLSSTSCSSRTKHKGDKCEVIDLLRDMQADRQHKKTKDDHWREKEELDLEREEEHKAREEEFKEQEHLFSQCVPMNIQQLSAALSMETNDLLKHDIQCKIIALINRKKVLGNKLNLN